MLALAYVIPLTQAATHDFAASGIRNLCDESPPQLWIPPILVEQSADFPNHVWDLEQEVVQEVLDDWDPDEQLRWRYPVVALRYQRPLEWSVVTSDSIQEVSDLIDHADEELCQGTTELFAVEVWAPATL